MSNYPLDALPASGFVRQSQLLGGPLPFSSATLWRKVSAGTFPQPVKLSERVTAWRVEDVRKWARSCEAATPAPCVKRRK